MKTAAPNRYYLLNMLVINKDSLSGDAVTELIQVYDRMSDYIIKLLCFIDPFHCIGDHTIKHVLGTSSIVIPFTTVDGSFVVDVCIRDNERHERGN